MKKALIVNLTLAIDKTVSVDKIRIVTIFRFPEALTYVGGKGVNVARVLLSLGGIGDLIGFVGGYTGKWIEASLKKENIVFHPIRHKNGESRMCYSIADKSGVTTDFNEDGQDVPLSVQTEFFRKLNEIIPRYSSLVICGRSPRGIKKGFYKKMAAIAKRNGVKIFFDISGCFLSEALTADLIKINKHEFEDFSGLKLNRESILKFFLKKSKLGLKMLIVTNGKQPGYAVSAKGLWIFHPININKRVKSTVGSGDSFMAGCVYGDLQKKSFNEIIKMSVGCATSNCLSLGAGAVKKEEVIKFTKKALLKGIEL